MKRIARCLLSPPLAPAHGVGPAQGGESPAALHHYVNEYPRLRRAPRLAGKSP